MKLMIVLMMTFLVSNSVSAQSNMLPCDRFQRDDKRALKCELLNFQRKFQREAVALCNRHNTPGKLFSCLRIIADRKYTQAQLSRCGEIQCEDVAESTLTDIADVFLGDPMNRCLNRAR